MAKKINLLVDTDVFIEYLNHQLFSEIFESDLFHVYYSVVTKKELLSKEGLSVEERLEIRKMLRRYRIVPLDYSVLDRFSDLIALHPLSPKEDTLIAATAISKDFYLATRNHRHFRIFQKLKLYFQT